MLRNSCRVLYSVTTACKFITNIYLYASKYIVEDFRPLSEYCSAFIFIITGLVYVQVFHNYWRFLCFGSLKVGL
jgi:hypothetical protein